MSEKCGPAASLLVVQAVEEFEHEVSAQPGLQPREFSAVGEFATEQYRRAFDDIADERIGGARRVRHQDPAEDLRPISRSRDERLSKPYRLSRVCRSTEVLEGRHRDAGPTPPDAALQRRRPGGGRTGQRSQQAFA